LLNILRYKEGTLHYSSSSPSSTTLYNLWGRRGC